MLRLDEADTEPLDAVFICTLPLPALVTFVLDDRSFALQVSISKSPEDKVKETRILAGDPPAFHR